MGEGMKVELSEILIEYHKRKHNKRKDSHLEGFYHFFKQRISDPAIEIKKGIAIQEFSYRSKRWDFSVWQSGQLRAVLELKSLHKSAAKNFNNRLEEAVGSAAFLKKAYPDVKIGYLCIGDNLSPRLCDRLIKFITDCQNQGWYDAASCIIVDKEKGFYTPEHLPVDQLIQRLTKGF
tara:strand:+ start:34 stop:564 length:531 start_codon:yes stop_codon:yes gene_type:complete